MPGLEKGRACARPAPPSAAASADAKLERRLTCAPRARSWFCPTEQPSPLPVRCCCAAAKLERRLSAEPTFGLLCRTCLTRSCEPDVVSSPRTSHGVRPAALARLLMPTGSTRALRGPRVGPGSPPLTMFPFAVLLGRRRVWLVRRRGHGAGTAAHRLVLHAGGGHLRSALRRQPLSARSNLLRLVVFLRLATQQHDNTSPQHAGSEKQQKCDHGKDLSIPTPSPRHPSPPTRPQSWRPSQPRRTTRTRRTARSRVNRMRQLSRGATIKDGS